MRKLWPRFDQSPVAGATTSLNWVHLAVLQAWTGFTLMSLFWRARASLSFSTTRPGLGPILTMRVLRALDPVRGCAYRLGEVHFLLALESGRSPAWLYLQEPSLAQWACGLAWVSSVGTWVLLRPLSRGLPSFHFSNFPASHGRPSMATYPLQPYFGVTSLPLLCS